MFVGDNRSFLPLVRRLKEKYEMPRVATMVAEFFSVITIEEAEKVRCGKCGKKLKRLPKTLKEEKAGEDTLWGCSTAEDEKIGHDVFWVSEPGKV